MIEPDPTPLLPTIDAALNATATLCLLVGYRAKRRGDHRRHGLWMTAALGASIAFLGFYLAHHFLGEPREFQGQGFARVLYFAMLITHVVLAAAIVPLVAITFLRGRRHDRARHEAIARWTLPLWLYVSVTGILVYFVLYGDTALWSGPGSPGGG